ncbi:DUF7010 family protein [Kangiella koreensis]|uniref:Transmembrane protein n=1 Tax=Kangiella koreensis (strain DSM 16069 / JCM 12317 / KCTC 12182 / SW-125) TaxID=523791 RepID=C7R697_KANKD|nr:hypothetical protein [Kangiella koreensis]ACV27325.1 hypothetical protein Kkor_1915 [Kangiella koreensis DSM 16069]
MMTINDAQQNMRRSYYDGAPGVVTSGLVWLAAGLIALFSTPKAAIIALLIGGMFIFPISILLCKLFGASGKHDKNNPLGPLAMEGTYWMLVSIPIAIAASLYKIEWFFPAMLLIIGGRYLTFRTLYGMKIFWVFGGTLVAAGFALYYFNAPVMFGAFTGAIIELVFGLVIFVSHKEELVTSSS